MGEKSQGSRGMAIVIRWILGPDSPTVLPMDCVSMTVHNLRVTALCSLPVHLNSSSKCIVLEQLVVLWHTCVLFSLFMLIFSTVKFHTDIIIPVLNLSLWCCTSSCFFLLLSQESFISTILVYCGDRKLFLVLSFVTWSKQLMWYRSYKQSCSFSDRSQPHTKTIIQGRCVQELKSSHSILDILRCRKAKPVRKSLGFFFLWGDGQGLEDCEKG